MTAPASHDRVGRYVLGKKLAAGGMGEVYAALDTNSGEVIVLKLLLPHLADDSDMVRSFLHEATSIARMDHPNVVRIFDVGFESGRYYLAMELVHGVPMSTLISRLAAADRRVPEDVLVYIARSLTLGLHHAHELCGPNGPLELVHRDVTPRNVLLSADGHVKLIDFGIAKGRESSSLTPCGFVKGTMGYVAPEQLLSQRIDRRTDLYGAAVSLFHLATLVPPFSSEEKPQAYHAILEDPLPLLSAVRSDISPGFSAAVARATEKLAAKRFATALEFAAALPPTAPGVQESLGHLVRELCAIELAQLDRKMDTSMIGPTDIRTGLITTGLAPVTKSSLLPLTLSLVRQVTPARPKAISAPVLSRSAVQRGRLRRFAASMTVLCLAFIGGGGGWLGAESLRGNENRRAAHDPAKKPAPPPVGPDVLSAAPLQQVQLQLSAPAPEPQRDLEPQGALEPQRDEPLVRSRPAPPPRPERRVRTLPAAPEAKAGGFLTVDAEPWAEVWIAGRKIGETPIDAHAVTTGPLTVTLANPETHRRTVRSVRIVSGKTTFVRAELR